MDFDKLRKDYPLAWEKLAVFIKETYARPQCVKVTFNTSYPDRLLVHEHGNGSVLTWDFRAVMFLPWLAEAGHCVSVEPFKLGKRGKRRYKWLLEVGGEMLEDSTDRPGIEPGYESYMECMESIIQGAFGQYNATLFNALPPVPDEQPDTARPDATDAPL